VIRRWTRRNRSRSISHGERTALARRERAVAHLARVRSRGARPAPPRRTLAWAALALIPLSVAAGVALAQPVSGAATRWWVGSSEIAAIHVRGAGHLSASEIATATGIERGARLASVDPDAVAARLAEHPWVARARAVRLSTGPLVVEVVERVPAAVLVTGPSGHSTGALAVDVTGTPFAEAAPGALAELPRLERRGEVTRGESDPQLAEAVALGERLSELGSGAAVHVSVPEAGDADGFVVRLPDLDARIVFGREDLDARVEKLATLLASRLPELAGAASVDLRFADQAVLRERPLSKGAAQAAAVRGRAVPSKHRPSG